MLLTVLNLSIMKVKKISLKNWSDTLTDNEMKATRGGYGSMRCTYKTSASSIETTPCVSVDMAIAICQFWAASGNDCRCLAC